MTTDANPVTGSSIDAGPLTDSDLFRARSHFGSLDALRAFAVIAVVWHHTVEPAAWLPLSGRGFLGVDLFFVLSGFLIVTLLLRERDRTGTISLKNFYARRSLRIFPLYYGILAVMALLVYGTSSHTPTAQAFRDTVPYYLTYTSNWFGTGALLAVSWSLAAEEQFYLVWPPIQRFAGRAILPILAVLVVLNQLVNFGVLFADGQQEREMIQVTFTPILLGVALAHVLHHHHDRVTGVLGGRLAAPVAGVAVLLVANLPNDTTSLVGVHRLTIHVLMVILVASVVVHEQHGLAPLLMVRPLARVGAISYGIYLLHMFVRHVADQSIGRVGLGEQPLVLFVATLAGVLVAAELSFRFFESPILRLKRRFASGSDGPTTPGGTEPVLFSR
ncbi:MAG: acyltransferase family protein [Acidimicrobiales bacterium]